MGNMFKTIKETRVSYATEANLHRAIERIYGAHRWQEALNGVSYIFTPLPDNERLMMYAYQDTDTWIKHQLNLNRHVHGTR